jgi:membrane-bound metal-dependent hydrolase YbcI (DUF457 family)
MFVFGHLGIGSGLVLLAKRDLPLGGVLAGTLAPDLVDKPLFYGLVRTRVLPEAACAMLRGTRTIGHTLLAAALVALVAFALRPDRRAWLAAAALGMVSHDALDIVSDIAASAHLHVPFTLEGSGAWRAAFFPLAGVPFGASLSFDFFQHFLASLKVHLATELLGVALLGAGFVAARTRRGIATAHVDSRVERR